MKGSPIFPGFDSDYNDNSSSYEFDPQADFAQFLAEARRYANEREEFPEKRGNNREELNTEKQSKKNNKSWKTALFSFWKTTEKKKSKQCPKEAPSSSSMGSHFVSPKPRGHVSGPIHWNGGAQVADQLPVSSGPLISLFHPKKREKDGKLTPYVSLDVLKKRQHGVKPYGPVYLVS